MKVRNGFVSNSSSSSFVLITDAGSHKKVLESMRKEENGEEFANFIDTIVGRKNLGDNSVHNPEVEIVVFATGSGENFDDCDPMFDWKGLDYKPASIEGTYGYYLRSSKTLNQVFLHMIELAAITDDEDRDELERDILNDIRNSAYQAMVYEAEHLYRETIAKLKLPHITQDLSM